MKLFFFMLVYPFFMWQPEPQIDYKTLAECKAAGRKAMEQMVDSQKSDRIDWFCIDESGHGGGGQGDPY